VQLGFSGQAQSCSEILNDKNYIFNTILRQFIETTIHRTTIYPTDSSSKRQFIEPTTYRTTVYRTTVYCTTVFWTTVYRNDLSDL